MAADDRTPGAGAAVTVCTDDCCVHAKHPVPGPQTAPGAPQSPNPTTTTPGGQTGAQGREQEETNV